MWRRDKLARQLGEAEELWRGSDRRMERVEPGPLKARSHDRRSQALTDLPGTSNLFNKKIMQFLTLLDTFGKPLRHFWTHLDTFPGSRV